MNTRNLTFSLPTCPKKNAAAAVGYDHNGCRVEGARRSPMSTAGPRATATHSHLSARYRSLHTHDNPATPRPGARKQALGPPGAALCRATGAETEERQRKKVEAEENTAKKTLREQAALGRARSPGVRARDPRKNEVEYNETVS